MTELEKSLMKNNELSMEQVAQQNKQAAHQNDQIVFFEYTKYSASKTK